jgi:lipopolysaccharide/colanic/teichoic acid biosynthesis glycosyltransferase
MSLVGPRPERPYFVETLKTQVPDYAKRLDVKPGITGLAQIRCGYDRNVRDVARKVRMDLMYIRRMCWLVDFRILLATVSKFFRG